MGLRAKRTIKVIIFLLITVLLFGIFSVVAQPLWNDRSYDNTDNFMGFYEEPPNTLETVFLGASTIGTGISPMYLFENYGICACTRATDAQPMLASYYLLKETYRLHEETLNTVILDASMLRKDPTEDGGYNKAIDLMEFSLDKINAVQGWSENFEIFLTHLFPLLNYHDRWKSLTEEDFLTFGYTPYTYARGYRFDASQLCYAVNSWSKIIRPLYLADSETEDTELDPKAVEYFEKIVMFCEDNSLSLTLIKTPTDWSSADHNAVQALSDSHGLDFLDFNIDPYYSEANFNFATDMRIDDTETNNLHLNYYGAVKLTDYLGKYLTSVCEIKDVRGDEKYAFMNEELTKYHRYIASASLLEYTDPVDYIRYALNQGDCTIFVSVKDDATAELTEEQRAYFASIGLTKLADLGFRDSYLAVIQDGSIVTEKMQNDSGLEDPDQLLQDELTQTQYEGKLLDGVNYSIISGGYNLGNSSSIQIDNEEYSQDQRGLNIVIYDNIIQKVVDSAVFDTNSSSQRSMLKVDEALEAALEDGKTFVELTGRQRILYQYTRACEEERKVKYLRQEVGEDGLLTYLDAFRDDENLKIFITVQGNRAEMFDEDIKDSLADMGLTELSQLENKNTYLAVIDGGEVLLEECGETGEPLEIKTTTFTLTSGGEYSDTPTSVMIDGIEYSEEGSGISIFVYDKITESMIDTITFDAKMFISSLPDIVES